MNLDDVADYFTKHRYYDRFDENRWREQFEEHPLLMTKPPTNPNEIPPLVEAMRQLKYSEECNSPVELAKQYKIDGNENYKSKKFHDAVASYAKGLTYLKNVDSNSDKEARELKSVLHSNKAACYVMMQRYQDAIKECKDALKIHRENARAKTRMEDCLKKIKSSSQ